MAQLQRIGINYNLYRDLRLLHHHEMAPSRSKAWLIANSMHLPTIPKSWSSAIKIKPIVFPEDRLMDEAASELPHLVHARHRLLPGDERRHEHPLQSLAVRQATLMRKGLPKRLAFVRARRELEAREAFDRLERQVAWQHAEDRPAEDVDAALLALKQPLLRRTRELREGEDRMWRERLEEIALAAMRSGDPLTWDDLDDYFDVDDVARLVADKPDLEEAFLPSTLRLSRALWEAMTPEERGNAANEMRVPGTHEIAQRVDPTLASLVQLVTAEAAQARRLDTARDTLQALTGSARPQPGRAPPLFVDPRLLGLERLYAPNPLAPIDQVRRELAEIFAEEDAERALEVDQVRSNFARAADREHAEDATRRFLETIDLDQGIDRHMEASGDDVGAYQHGGHEHDLVSAIRGQQYLHETFLEDELDEHMRLYYEGFNKFDNIDVDDDEFYDEHDEDDDEYYDEHDEDDDEHDEDDDDDDDYHGEVDDGDSGPSRPPMRRW